jgi:hypothetical protein
MACRGEVLLGLAKRCLYFGFWVGFLRVMVMVRLLLWVVFWVDFLRVKMGVTLPVKSLCGMGFLHGIVGTDWGKLPASHPCVF